MNLARLKMLEEFAREDPSDPFNLYALALEYQSFDPDKATSLFDQLLAQHPTYVPTYYHAGNFFLERDSDKAIGILRRGKEHAIAANDRKAAGEIQSLLDSLE